MTFENRYNDLVALSKTSPNWAKTINMSLPVEQRLEGAKGFCNEAAFSFNAQDNITAGDHGSYGMLWRQSKGSVADDCLAIIGTDGKTYESDIIKNADSVGGVASVQWSSPVLSQWSYQAPVDPGTASTQPPPPNPNPEPEPPPMPQGPFAPYSTIPQDVPTNPDHGWEFWLRKYFEGGNINEPQKFQEQYRAQAFDAWRRAMQSMITARGQYDNGGWNTPGSHEDWMLMADEAGKAMHQELNSRP